MSSDDRETTEDRASELRHHVNELDTEFRRELEQAINRTCQENGSGTPDFVLANYLDTCLRAFDLAVNARERWYGRPQHPTFHTPVVSRPMSPAVDTGL